MITQPSLVSSRWPLALMAESSFYSDNINFLVCNISILISFFLLFVYFRSKHGLPWNWPFLGMVPGILFHFHHIHDYATSILEKTPGCTALIKGPWFASKDILLTSNPSNVYYTSCTKFSNFPKGSKAKKCFDIFGDGLFNTEGEEWNKHRRILRAFFSHQLFNKVSTRMILKKVKEGLVPIVEEACKKHDVVDLQDLMRRFAYDVTYNMNFGVDPKSLSSDHLIVPIPFFTAMSDAMEAVILRHLFPECLWRVQSLLGIGKEGVLARAKKTLERIVSEQLSSRGEFLMKGGQVTRFDLLTTYMEAGNEFETTFNDKVLKDSISSLMLAGTDTTSVTLTWFFYAISKSPSSLAKIREEMERTIAIAKNDQKGQIKGFHEFTLEELSELNYLQAALCETLRLYPAIPFQVRVPIEPDILPTGHVVYPNTAIVIPLYAMGRMTTVWGQDCFEFKPERWMNDRGELKHEPAQKFFTFNAGPRICLGKEIAFVKMKAVAATILYNYDADVLIEKFNDVSPVVSAIFWMKHGLKTKFTNRWT